MPTTTIGWCTHVWNPFTGCDRVSPGCAHCYAADAARSLKAREQGRAAAAARDGRAAPRLRYQADGDPKTSGPGFGFTVHWDKLENPERFPAGARVFVNSMSDVFHEEAPLGAIAQMWGVFASRPDVTFLVLTKRPKQMLEVLTDDAWVLAAIEEASSWVKKLGRPLEGRDNYCWPADDYHEFPALRNVWLGVTIENRRFVHRADLLRETPAAVRFISAEPLLGPLFYDSHDGGDGHPATESLCWSDGADLPDLDLRNIDWLITGGESGPAHRRFDPTWATEAKEYAHANGTAFFHKQNGGRRAREGGRLLDGCTYDEIPVGAGAAV